MSKKDNGSSWSKEWMDLQRQYLDAMSDFIPSPPKPDSKRRSENPMSSAMDFWWQSLSPKLSEENREFIDKMAEQGRIFYALSDQFINLLKAINEATESEEHWEGVLNAQFDQLKKYFTDSENGREAMRGLTGAWNLLPMDTLQRVFSSSTVLPGDFLGEIKPEALEEVTDKFLSIPGVGYTRESQEQIQTFIKRWNEYEKILRRYNNAMFRVGIQALEKMRNKILDMAKEGKQITRMREIYDIWVDCNEEAYAEYVYTDEFSELYGELTNALMAVKHQGQNMIDEALSSLNIPTRHGMNTTFKRQQQLRRDYQTSIKKLTELEKRIERLQASGQEKDAKAETETTQKSGQTRKTPSKKKTKKKKKSAGSKKKAARKTSAGKKAGNRKSVSPGKVKKGKAAAENRSSSRAGSEKIVIKL